jgi:hypothetical protein
MGEDLETVQTEVDELMGTMEEVQTQTETTMTFFEELRRLLQEMFGASEPEAEGRIPPSGLPQLVTTGRS